MTNKLLMKNHFDREDNLRKLLSLLSYCHFEYKSHRNHSQIMTVKLATLKGIIHHFSALK
ncbi:MAG: hypothetical protein ACD_24C00527G0001 [uncultured bacterium]|nr:MAG: hypothetical protein ACD_24C00527G0001 [uncultured bacterium]